MTPAEARDCRHGRLARSCPECGLMDDLVEISHALALAERDASEDSAALKSVQGALVDAGCSVGEQDGFGDLVRGLAAEVEEGRRLLREVVRRTEDPEAGGLAPIDSDLYEQLVAHLARESAAPIREPDPEWWRGFVEMVENDASMEDVWGAAHRYIVSDGGKESEQPPDPGA